MTETTRYTRLQIGLHWITAVLIVGAWLTHEDMGRALRTRIETGTTGIEGNTLHVWLGGAAFALILVRVVARLVQGGPGPVPGNPAWMQAAALWGHRLLYLLMVLVPLSGSVAWYGHVRAAGETHEVIGGALMLLALTHAVVAIGHKVWLKDDTMERMIKPQG